MAAQLENDLCCASIVEVLMNKIDLWSRAHADDWTVEWAIIASDHSREFSGKSNEHNVS